MVRPQKLRLRINAVVFAVASVVAVAACGEGSGSGSGGGASAGQNAAVVEGPVSAGLIAQQDGWSFPNFPASTYPDINFDAADLVSMFGADASVCVDGAADPCVLTAEAAAWARMVNQARSTGHCEGLVALAAARFNAAEQIKTVTVPDQEETIRTVMRTFATQFVPEVQEVIRRWSKASLAEKVDELKTSFADGKANYTLGVYVEGGGHAVLPYAVEYPSPDTPRIMVYDSNWPAKNRFIDVDLVNNSWRFSFAGADPANDPDVWTGGPADMDLTPFDSRQGTCPFCGNDVKVAGTTLLLRTADLDWSVSTPDGVVSPSENSTGGAVVAKPVKGGARDSYDYLIQIPPSKNSSTTTTAAVAASTQLVFGGSASVFAIMPTGIASFTTPGGSGQPVEVGNGSVSSKDPAVSMSLASGNLVAAASGASAELVASGETMAVTVTAENGQVITQEVTPETPTVQIKADEGSGGLTVLAQASTGEVAKTEIASDGTETKTVVPAGTLNLAEDLNKVEVELPKELESKPLAVLPSLEDRNLANPNYKPDTAYVAPTTIPAKIEEAAPATTVQVKNAALPTTTERGETPSTVQTRNAASPTTIGPRSVTAANTDTSAAAVVKPSLANFRVAAKTFGDDAFTLDPPDSNSAGGFRYTSSNLNVATVSSTTGRVTITGAGSTVITATQSAAKGFEAGTITATLTVGKAKAVLSALKDTAKVFGDDPFTIKEPTSTSPAEISWTSSNESVAKFSKTTGRLVIAGAGKTTITATQAATNDFLAGSESFVLSVGRATPALAALTDVAKTYGDTGFTIAKPTSDSRGAMTFASSDPKVASVDSTSGTVTIVGAGTTTITLTQSATDDYVAASKTFKLTVGKAKAVWGEFKAIDKTFGDANFKVTLPTSTSDGVRTFSSSDDKVATVDTTTGDVKIVGAGTTTLAVNQAASTNFESSTVTTTLTVGKASPEITGVSLLDLVFGGKDEKLEPKSTSPGAFTFSSSDSKILTVDSVGNVKVVGVGSATITAKQASTANFEAGSASVTVKVGKGTPAFERLSPINKEYGDANFAFAPTGSPSDGTYTYTSSNTAVASVNTSTGIVTITGVGVTTLTATQAATDTYVSASTQVVLTVGRGVPSLGNFTIPTKTFGEAAFTVAPPSSTSTGAFTYASSNTAVASINSTTGLVTLVGGGSATITATQAATTRHTAASIVTTLRVELPQIVKMSLGHSSCAITNTAGLKCWGNNGYGQLGDGTVTNRTSPIDVSGLTSGVISVATGLSHTCAVVTGDSLKCWGYNAYGQLGDGTSINRTSPVSVSTLTLNVATVATGANHTCITTSMGGVKCWGQNNVGQLGDGTTTNRSTPVDVTGLTSGVISISARGNHTCAVLISGGVTCWGSNNYGQLGDGTTTNRNTPIAVAGLASGFKAVVTGWENSCAVSVSGGVKCWGYNAQGQLGDGTTTNRSTPVDVVGLASGAVSLTEGWDHKCVIMGVGGLKCWGNNAYGQLGDGTTTHRTAAVDIPGVGSEVIMAFGGHHSCVLVATGEVKCWGYNAYGQLGDGTTANRATPFSLTGIATNLKPRPTFGPFDLPISTSTNLGSSFTVQAPTSTSAGTFTFTSSNPTVATVNASTGAVSVVGYGSTLINAVQAESQGYSAGSSSLSIAVAVPTVTSFTAALGPDRVDLSWSYPTVDTAATSDFVVEYSTSSTFATFSTFNDGVSNQNFARVTGLNDLSWYYFRVVSVSSSGLKSSASSVARIKYTIQASVTGTNVGSIKQSATSMLTSCVVYSDGRLRCWGQANPGTSINDAVSVDVGRGWFACALVSGGQVKCWGENGRGELGRGTIGGKDNTPALVPSLTDVVQISVGENHACALLSNDTMKCWGDNTNRPGKLGNGGSTSTGTPSLLTTAGFTNIRQVKLLSYDTCILKWDGTVKCVINYQISPATLSGGVAIEGSYITICIKTSSNQIKCSGTTGYGSSYDPLTPVAGLENVVNFARSIAGICAVVTDGRLLCRDATGLYQDAEFGNMAKFTGGSWDNVYCIVDTTDHVRCKGYANASPGYGHGLNAGANNIYHWIYVPEIGTSLPASSNAYLSSIAHGSSTCLPIEPLNDNTLTYSVTLPSWEATCKLMPSREDRHALLELNGVYIEPNTYATVEVPVNTGLNLITLRVVAQDLTETRTYTLRVTRLPALPLAAVSVGAGQINTCVTNIAGSLKCTGNNAYGQVGNGTTTTAKWLQLIPQLTSGMKQVTVGYQHACGLTVIGGVKCWGYNNYGQVGDGTTTNRATPVDVAGLSSGVASISSTANATCALLTDSGGVKCWGFNGDGALGDGTTVNRPAPVDVLGMTSGVVALSGGHGHMCAVTSVGAAKCWGWNSSGMLGNGSTISSASPVQVTGLTSGIVAIEAGLYQTCALTVSGSVQCWGNNTWGNFGNGTTVSSNTPIDIGVSGVTSMSAGLAHFCITTTVGAARCAGSNGWGQLGDGTTTTRSTFADVAGLGRGVRTIESGGDHSCATLSDLTVKCWGRNDQGQLGDATTTNRTSPVNLPDNGLPS